MKTVGELRAELAQCADEDELVLNIDTKRITIDPAEVKRVEIDDKPDGTQEVHLLIGDWG